MPLEEAQHLEGTHAHEQMTRLELPAIEERQALPWALHRARRGREQRCEVEVRLAQHGAARRVRDGEADFEPTARALRLGDCVLEALPRRLALSVDAPDAQLLVPIGFEGL